MSRKRIINVIKKEWQVIATDLNSILLITIVPLLIVGEFTVMIWLISKFGSQAILASTLFQGAISKMLAAIPGAGLLPPTEQLQVALLSQFNFYLLLIPTMIAVTFATFSIVDEKTSGSLEALLATPVRTWELLLGKALSGAIPALVVTWVYAAIFLGAVTIMGWGNLISLVLNPAWFLFLFLLTPAIAVLSFLLGVIGSSRAKDAKNAQNYVLLIILPMLALIALQVTGIMWFTTALSIVLGLAIAMADIIVLRVAVSLFQRESIVVRWR